MSQFLVLSRRRTESYRPTDFAPVLPAETERVRALYAAGVVRQIWMRGDVPGAAFLLEAENEEEVRATVDSLPMATSGLSEFTVLPLTPYRGFGALHS